MLKGKPGGWRGGMVGGDEDRGKERGGGEKLSGE